MSAPIRDKILDALHNIGDMVAQPVPILPPEIADPQDTIAVELCLHNTRASVAELYQYVDSVRQARDDWVKLIERMTAAERPVEGQACGQFMTDNDVQNQTRIGSNRLRELRGLEGQIIARRARDQAIINQVGAAAAAAAAAGAHFRAMAHPKLKLKIFKSAKGEVKWSEFWSIFRTSIHEDPMLAPVRKLAYLKTQLQGEASTLKKASI